MHGAKKAHLLTVQPIHNRDTAPEKYQSILGIGRKSQAPTLGPLYIDFDIVLLDLYYQVGQKQLLHEANGRPRRCPFFEYLDKNGPE